MARFKIVLFAMILCGLQVGIVWAEVQELNEAQKTQVVIIGTIHSAHHENSKYSPEILKEIILSLKPDVILNELPLSLVDPNGRPVRKIRGRNNECPETWAADEAAQQLGIKQIPFDRPDREQFRKQNDYYNRKKRSSKERDNWHGRMKKQNPEAVELKISLLQKQAWQAQNCFINSAGPELINSEGFDSIVKVKDSIWMNIMPVYLGNDPSYQKTTKDCNFLVSEWQKRNRIMADNIIKIADEYPGRRLVVVTGATHRYILRDLLKDEPYIDLKEYWEIIEPNTAKSKNDEAVKEKLQLKKKEIESVGIDFISQDFRAKKNSVETFNQSLSEPIEYVLKKLEQYDLVMIGERHWNREEPVFIQNLIKRCYEKDAIDAIFFEFGNFEDQGKIDAFLEADEYDPEPVVEVLRNSYEFGWGYQEYFDIFKIIYNENKKKPTSKKIKIVLTGFMSPENMNQYSEMRARLEKYLELSPLLKEKKLRMAKSILDAFIDRDSSMANVIEMYRYDLNCKKGIFYAGGSHVRKDLMIKNYGRRYFSTGGILTRKYPGRIYCLTFHNRSKDWRSKGDFNFFEELFKNYTKSFAIDTDEPRISHLRLRSRLIREGVALSESFDGYIMLNQEKDYHRCDFIPGFYDDEFAKVVWERLHRRGILERFPPEFKEWSEKTPTGEELMKLIEQGLH